MLGGGLMAEIAIWTLVILGFLSAITNAFRVRREYKLWRAERRRRKAWKRPD